ncbi:AAA family ATPase [Heliophilum fasciatum]|uniref:Putative AbiEii toxin of type IV toxin-antitoxin system n=1 Tax=Heliophilum fasciatum TaxID=35700 RepID=A0A4R2RN64_9FIRM|nr:ATP-binding protein [Heliophilum fasciatum]MCW2279126.1 hypothetical protein [Heliophilum fasciatum]TCP61211.1 putative AbiEii toxin of type IV toxin-antitoxin system [Heliophilum fasciatum]
MLRWLDLQDVGPAPQMRMDLAERINAIAGDNGLGKTFLLDIAWWALTRTWAGTPALPLGGKLGVIEYQVHGKTGDATPVKSIYRPDRQDWPIKVMRPPIPGIVIYLRIDGGFSVWDPARNYWRKDSPDRPAAYHFNHRQIWDGLKIGDVSVCEGLERDWVSWQKGREEQFEILGAVLEKLSPPGERLRPGKPTRVFLGEGFDRPTLQLVNGDVPVVLSSAGLRRVLALAYLMVWVWHEHRQMAKLLFREPETRMTILIDEPENHLHPNWQRRFIPALLEAAKILRVQHASDLQLIFSTHSPMVLASLEPIFDEAEDALFHLHNTEGKVMLEKQVWAKQGDVTNWLVSEVFGLEQARSVEAEKAIEAAEAWMRGEINQLPPGLNNPSLIDSELKRVLAGHDPFWPRWIIEREKSAGGKKK